MKPRHLAPALLVLPLALAACGGGTRPAPGNASAPTTAPPPATPSNHVIAPQLAAMARQVQAAANGSAAAALSNTMIHVNRRRQIQVYIHVKRLAPAVEQALVNAGAADVRASQPLGLYQAWATPRALTTIAALDAVTKITPPTYGFPAHTH